MSALAASKSPNPTNKSLAQAESDLRAESVAIEKLRKQIQEAGGKASKEMMADFAKRQKAFLDQKIVLEKRKLAVVDAPVAPVEKVTTKSPEAQNPPKPSDVAKSAEPGKPTATKSEPLAKTTTESSALTKEAAPAVSPAKRGSAVSTVVWLLVVAAVAVVVWHFANK